MKHTKIGIIGGLGRMGNWFAELFRKKGYEVYVSDKDTELTNKDIVETCDVVLFSLPIHVTPEVIESLAEFSREGTLWMDTTSVKVPAVNAMLKSKAEVIGMHPMFGNTARTMKNQTVIICEARVKKWKGWLEGIIQEEGGKIKKATPVEHDKVMAVIQGLTHFSMISLGHAFKQLGIDIKDSLEYTSPIYRMRLDMMGRVLAQDPELYASIEIENPETQNTLREYIQSIMKLYMIVKDKEIDDFMQYFKEASDHMGDFKKQAMDESQFLIEKLSEKELN